MSKELLCAIMLIIFFVTHALIYISKRNLTNHTWCVEFVSRFATHMSLLTNNTIKVKNEYLHLLSFQTNSVYAELVFCEILKTLIINSSAIIETSSELIQTSSELISTSSELIRTSSELIFRIAEQIAFAPHCTLRWAAESGDLRGVLVSYPRLKA